MRVEAHAPHPTVPPATWHPTWTDDVDDRHDDESADDGDESAGIEREIAEKNLLRKLRSRSLSIREARRVVEERDLAPHDVDAVIARVESLGYLDDAALAEQLVHAAVDRKGQGRHVIAQTLNKRGIPRDVADAAIAALPDDDLDRALEFARTKARAMSGLDRDTAIRRLMGQLARRGYGGSIASNAARQALTEVDSAPSGVRFR
ncbi:regulatory protein RecX [Microbacterium sp. SLBN-146]|uniref:regulatory protein RecX n=1 Tax=Microbacterium sp. SLBN-146 TaxID=2768457 RepID=UPI0021B2B4F7|nr:regulatory protein RecX [Microbacterium sp. SLBN-146]